MPAGALAGPGDLWAFGADWPVTADPSHQQRPAIDGDLAVWEDCRPDGIRCRVFYRDLSGEEPEKELVAGADGQDEVAADGGLIVWRQQIKTPAGGIGYQIHYLHMGETLQFPVSPASYRQYAPAVSGSRVAWSDERRGSKEADIYMYDFTTGIEQPLCTESSRQERPDIKGDWVIWTDNRGGTYSYGTPTMNDIYAKNVVTGEERQLSFDARNVVQTNPVLGINPRTGGYRAVWEGGGIWLYDFDSGETIQLAGAGYRPAIDGDIVVWEDAASRGISMQDLTTGETQQVSAGGGGCYHPDVSGSRIIWGDERNGNRDIYENELGSQARELAERYAPHLFLHSGEYFEPRKVDIMTGGAGTRLMKESPAGPVMLAQGVSLSTSTLFQFNDPASDGPDSTATKFVDLPGDVSNAWDWKYVLGTEWVLRRDYVDVYEGLVAGGDFPETVYAHVVREMGGSRTIIQYWLPYYFNNFANYHEGDWEHVDVALNGNLEPVAAAVGQHEGGKKREWRFVEGPGSNPVFYIARGSHANYFAAGDFKVPVDGFFDQTDHAEAHGPVHEPLVEVLPDVSTAKLTGLGGTPWGWLAYQGIWGEPGGTPGSAGPQGPAASPEHTGVWDDPFSWFDDCEWDGSGEELFSGGTQDAEGIMATVASPVALHLYDREGRHTGRREDGGIDQEIAGAEYMEIPEMHRKTIIVHGGDVSDGYRFVLVGEDTGTFDFAVSAPVSDSNISETAQHLGVPVTGTATAEILLDANQDYALEIDTDSDGTVDEIRQPDAVNTHDVDLQAPARIADLTVQGAASGSAVLTFTATGDDGSSGTASSYDIRYYEEPITHDNWKLARPLKESPLPQMAGAMETVTAEGLDAGASYYFAAEAVDEAGNSSGLSNVASNSTRSPHLAWSFKRAYWGSWYDYIYSCLSVDYGIDNQGAGDAYDVTIQGSVCGPTTVHVKSALPLSLGDISANDARIVTLKYDVPAAVVNFTSYTSASCADDSGNIHRFPEVTP